MPVWKLQTSIWNDSLLARDAFVITPHFNDQGIGSDPQGLCDDWAAAVDAIVSASGNHQIIVKAYDAEGTEPVFPAGEATLHPGGLSNSNMPREVALCLSFYSVQNRPRYRGRLYIPGPLLGATPGVRPSDPAMATVGSFATAASDLGGVDVDWCVWSRVDSVARKVTNWWVDNEWDTVRSRGQRATARIAGTTGE